MQGIANISGITGTSPVMTWERRLPITLVQRRRLGLQAGDELGRTLHGDALVVELEAVEAAELYAVASAAGATVVALRHDDAVPAMNLGDCGLHHQQAAVTGRQLIHRPSEEIAIIAVHRG